jgi:hypothetical protein
MAVNRTDKLSQVKFDALATLANSKPTLAGRPYAFLATGHWRTELERLRANLFKAVTIEIYTASPDGTDGWSGWKAGIILTEDIRFPMPLSALVSGPWPVPATETNPLAITVGVGLRNEKQAVLNGRNYSISYSTVYKRISQISYIFPSPVDPPTTKLIYRLSMGGVQVKQSETLGNGFKFRIQIVSPAAGRLHGSIRLTAAGYKIISADHQVRWRLTGPDGGSFAITNSEAPNFNPTLGFDFQTNGNVEFSLVSDDIQTVVDQQNSPPSFQAYDNTGTTGIFFDMEFANAYRVGGIHPTQNVYRIDTEATDYLNGIQILRPDEDVPVMPPPYFEAYTVGNQAVARITVSDNTHGIFIGKTLPISQADFYQTSEKLEPTRNVKAPLNNAGFDPVKPAIFDTIPRFSVQRSTDQITKLRADAFYLDPGETNYRGEYASSTVYHANDTIHYSVASSAGYWVLSKGPSSNLPPPGGFWFRTTVGRTYDARVYYGSILRDVYVRRLPSVQGDFELPKPADECPALDVELGCIRNGAFTAFQKVTIPQGQHGLRIFPFWPVFDIWNGTAANTLCENKLIYRCTEQIDVQASLMMPQPTFGTQCIPPKLADFYNDTEALLGLL